MLLHCRALSRHLTPFSVRCREQICDTAEDEIRGNVDDDLVKGLVDSGLQKAAESNGAMYKNSQANGRSKAKKYFMQRGS